jgi:DNA-binding protein H-NS
MGGLCSSPAAEYHKEMLEDLQHHCDEQTEIIETMIEVEAEDKSHLRALKKDLKSLDILLDQYESALKSLGDLLPKETLDLLQKLSSKRTRVDEKRRKRAKEAGMEVEEHMSLVRPSDAKIQKAQSTATAKKVENQHAATSDAHKGQVEARREKARERVKLRLKQRDSSSNGGGNGNKSFKPARKHSITPLPDSVRRHPSLSTVKRGMSKDI